MIKIGNTDVYGFEAAIRGMRNPLNSWEKSDSFHGCTAGDYGKTESQYCDEKCKCDCEFIAGYNDRTLMMQLVKAGSDHSKFMRMITVTCDITAPLYWWKEMDTYKVGTDRNSCSTMHKILDKEFTLDDFSHEHLGTPALQLLSYTITFLNECRNVYKNSPFGLNEITGFECASQKDVWWQIIQLLPSSYNQRATWQANYAVLRNIYHARKNHKLDEWHDFCAWIERLPYSELIIGGTQND